MANNADSVVVETITRPLQYQQSQVKSQSIQMNCKLCNKGIALSLLCLLLVSSLVTGLVASLVVVGLEHWMQINSHLKILTCMISFVDFGALEFLASNETQRVLLLASVLSFQTMFL